ncbi:hypothetical protein DFR88_00655 [Metallosphaera sedula]|uniref:Uncharacterized protein n=1 Tax=Metallosphaera prunae TaxID=47304 RepID=A0A4D8S167_METPR|nr:hypothetical protein DFR88_00655 [Metallosphaera prunae]
MNREVGSHSSVRVEHLGLIPRLLVSPSCGGDSSRGREWGSEEPISGISFSARGIDCGTVEPGRSGTVLHLRKYCRFTISNPTLAHSGVSLRVGYAGVYFR